jgi:putative toxin-antitoxin system antitoxin component (TIGR02293 family)
VRRSRNVNVRRIIDSALRLFEGDAAAARQWLHTPSPALAGKMPIRLAETEHRWAEVDALIAQLEHGVIP